MSARDDLDRFERDWGKHLEWRKSGGSTAEGTGRGTYLDGRDGWVIRLRMVDLPNPIRDAFLLDLEATIGAALDAKYQTIHRDMRMRARAEAEQTLAALKDEVAGG